MSGQKYPNRDEIRTLFKNLENKDNFSKFFARVDDNVDWTIMGTSPMSRTYDNLEHFQTATLGRLKNIMKEPGLTFRTRNVIGGGDHEWAAVEMAADATCNNGLPYLMVYNWNIRFDDKGNIVQVRAYLDTELLTQALVQNEVPSTRANVEF